MVSLQGLGVHFFKGWNIVVPFEEGRRGADTFDCSGIETPNRIEYRVIVRVENVFFELRMACNVNLRDTLCGNTIDVVEWIETVILGRDVDVIYVEEDAAIGGLDDLVQELPLGHLRLVKFGVAADVFYGNGDFEEVLHLADAGCRRLHCFEGVGHGEEIVGIAAIDTSPTEMVG